MRVANGPELAHLCPTKSSRPWPTRAATWPSESTFYRVLRAADQLARRGKPKAPARVRPAPLVATGPNQVWSWDITYLATAVRGVFFYLYLIMDVYSRKIVGWKVYATESTEQAAGVFHKAYLRERVRAKALVLHSDNGSPMKGATWYHTEHRHSGLKFVTADQRHRGEDSDLLARRHALYQAAKALHPERWSGPTRNWQPAATVFLNPGKPLKTAHQTQPATA